MTSGLSQGSALQRLAADVAKVAALAGQLADGLDEATSSIEQVRNGLQEAFGDIPDAVVKGMVADCDSAHDASVSALFQVWTLALQLEEEERRLVRETIGAPSEVSADVPMPWKSRGPSEITVDVIAVPRNSQRKYIKKKTLKSNKYFQSLEELHHSQFQVQGEAFRADYDDDWGAWCEWRDSIDKRSLFNRGTAQYIGTCVVPIDAYRGDVKFIRIEAANYAKRALISGHETIMEKEHGYYERLREEAGDAHKALLNVHERIHDGLIRWRHRSNLAALGDSINGETGTVVFSMTGEGEKPWDKCELTGDVPSKTCGKYVALVDVIIPN